MQFIYSPIVDDSRQVDYQINQNNILKVQDGQQTVFFDLSQLNPQKEYEFNEYVQQVDWMDDDWLITLIKPIGFEATEAQRFPKPFEMPISDFEIDGKINQLVEIKPDKSASLVDVLESKIKVLESQNEMHEDLIQEMAMMLYD
ncbi:hypothetical protein [Atopobacter phocae]|uniref:hypothetical protein n=1 Tax=Atopobacter phocae TaxID=136492 RepID=UPI000471AA59|nr:hypothetical protein [Atopobacter phocae]